MKYPFFLFSLLLSVVSYSQVPTSWSSGSTYSSGALVLNSNGVSYIALQDIDTAGILLSDENYWLPLDAVAPSNTPPSNLPATPDIDAIPITTPDDGTGNLTPSTNTPTSWLLERSYILGDLVTGSNGFSYIAKKNVPTGILLSNQNYWQILDDRILGVMPPSDPPSENPDTSTIPSSNPDTSPHIDYNNSLWNQNYSYAKGVSVLNADGEQYFSKSYVSEGTNLTNTFYWLIDSYDAGYSKEVETFRGKKFTEGYYEANDSTEAILEFLNAKATTDAEHNASGLGKQEVLDDFENKPEEFDFFRIDDFEKQSYEIADNQKNITSLYTSDWVFVPHFGWLFSNRSVFPYFFDPKSNEWMKFVSVRNSPFLLWKDLLIAVDHSSLNPLIVSSPDKFLTKNLSLSYGLAQNQDFQNRDYLKSSDVLLNSQTMKLGSSSLGNLLKSLKTYTNALNSLWFIDQENLFTSVFSSNIKGNLSEEERDVRQLAFSNSGLKRYHDGSVFWELDGLTKAIDWKEKIPVDLTVDLEKLLKSALSEEFGPNYLRGKNDAKSDLNDDPESLGFMELKDSDFWINGYLQVYEIKMQENINREKNDLKMLINRQSAFSIDGITYVAKSNLSVFEAFLDFENDKPYTDGWFYDVAYGWLWMTEETFPFFYDYLTQSWLYFFENSEGPQFYHYNSKNWYDGIDTHWSDSYYLGGEENLKIVQSVKEDSNQSLHLFGIKSEGINMLSKLDSIEELFIDFNESDQSNFDFSSLKNLKNLRRLFLKNVSKGWSGESVYISGINQLTNLEELYISGNFEGVEDFNNLSNLRELKLEYNGQANPVNFSFLENLDYLETLWVKGRYGEGDIYPSLKNLKDLMELELTGFPDSSLLALEGLHGVQILSLRVSDEKAVDLSPIQKMTELSSFRLSCGAVESFAPLTTTKLSRFWLSCNSESNPIPDLSWLGELETLVDLMLTSSSDEDFMGLPALSSVLKLNIGSEVSDLAPFSNLKDIVDLSIRRSDTRDLSPLSTLKNLVNLELGEVYNITNLSPLISLSALKRLRINVPVFDYAVMLQNFQHLDQITFDSFGSNKPSVSDIFTADSILPGKTSFFGYYFSGSEIETPSLGLIDIKVGEAEKTNLLNLSHSGFSDLDSLPSLPSLEKLVLNETSLTSLDAISKFPNLTHLSMISCPNFDGNLSYLANLEKLEELLLGGSKLDTGSVPTLPNLKTLECDLYYSQEEDTYFLQKLPALTQLYLLDPPNNMEGISNLSNLEELTIYLMGESLKSLEGFKHLKKLKHFSINSFYHPTRGTRSIVNLSPLEYLDQLESVRIDGPIFDLVALHNLKSLQTVNVTNTLVGYREKINLFEKNQNELFVENWYDSLQVFQD